MKQFPCTLILVGLGLVLLTGCVPKAVREKQAQFCTHLATLSRAIDSLNRIGNSSTVSELKQAEVQITTAFRAVQASSQEVADLDLEPLEKAYEDLDQTVEDIPDQASITQAVELVANHLETVESAVVRVKAEARCPQ